MDPNINQSEGVNQMPQAGPQPISAPGQPVAPAAPQTLENPKKGMGKGIILIVILLLLVVGITAYILFAKAQINNTQKTTTDNTSSVIPSPTAVPTLAPEEDLEVGSPEADLLELDASVKDL